MGIFSELYPDQKNILEHWHQVKSIAYKDEEFALETILFSALHGIQKGEKSLVVIPNTEARQKILHLIHSLGLEPICLSYEPDSSVTREDVVRIQKQTQAKQESRKKTEALEANYHFSRNLKMIHNVLSAYHSPDGDRTIFSVHARLLELGKFENLAMADALSKEWFPELDENYFDVCYDQIIKASKLYHPSYNVENSSFSFKVAPEFLKDENQIDQLLFSLGEFIQEMTMLREKYFQLINAITQQASREANSEFIEVSEKLDRVEFLCVQIQNKGPRKNTGILNLFSEPDRDQEAWSQGLKTLLENLQTQISNWNDVIDVLPLLKNIQNIPAQWDENLNIIRDKVALYFEKRKKSTWSVFKYSNIYNQAEKKQLQDLEDEFFKLSQKINEEKIFRTPLEINTLSLEKQTGLLNIYILECKSLQTHLAENKNHYVWLSFLEKQTDEVRNMIEKLRHFDMDDWPRILEYCFLKRWIEEKICMDPDRFESMLQDFPRLLSQVKEYWFYEIVHQNLENRSKKISQFDKSEKNLWASIQQNKGIEKLNWRYFFENNVTFWSTFYDIVVTSSDQFPDMKDGYYTNLLYLNVKDINPEVLHLGKTIHSYFPESELFSAHSDLRLSGESIHVEKGKPLKTLETLRNARALAHKLYSVQPKFFLYQSKSHSIISCLHPLVNPYVLSGLKQLACKEIQISENPVERLVECLVDPSKKQYLLIHDHMVNPSEIYNLGVHTRVLEEARLLGIQVLSIGTGQLVGQFDKEMSRFCQSIHQN